MAMDSGDGSFNESDFWRVLSYALRKAGAKVLQPALELYYSSRSANTPNWAKAVAIVALIYLINPLDGIPDPTPFFGFGDDLFTMSVAINSIGRYVDAEIKRKAEAKARELLGL